MVEFKKDNGLYGLAHAYHTATGYECVANHPGNNKGKMERVIFYAKHIVAADGRPYTEIGLSGLLEHERESAINEIKSCLRTKDFTEVSCLTQLDSDSHSFMEHKCAEFGSIAVRVCAGKTGISIVMDIIGQMVLDTSREFIKEQEQIPNVLAESIMCSMGDEMKRGPGGVEMAQKRAADLAYHFENGVSEIALMG